MKNINDEALKEGENVFITIKKLGKGMTKFGDVVRFITTKHPERREGLLKSNLDELDDEEKLFHNLFMIINK